MPGAQQERVRKAEVGCLLADKRNPHGPRARMRGFLCENAVAGHCRGFPQTFATSLFGRRIPALVGCFPDQWRK
jgi:hypothetical protein